jgi:hypothetical protein
MFNSNASSADAGGADYIEDVFSTYLYTGNGSTQTITNDIDLDGEGGLVWIKSRSAAGNNFLFDTTRGVNNEIRSNATNAQSTVSNSLTAFNSNGFSIGDAVNVANNNAVTYASWTFREQPKFFDVVTYTGDGVNNRQIPHSLGSVPGFMLVKRTNAASSWFVYHRSLGGTQYMELETTGAAVTTNQVWNNTNPTSTVFTLGNTAGVNGNGDTFVAYLFAHDAGGFGLTGTDNVISCGSYTGNGGELAIDLGWEPQWVMVKASSFSRNWLIMDNMRGITTGGPDPFLCADQTFVEEVSDRITLNPNGFSTTSSGSSDVNSSGETYIYIAIRRGPMKVPTDGTSVFDADAYTTNGTDNRLITTNTVVDLNILKARSSESLWGWADRLRGGDNMLQSNATDAESTGWGLGLDTNVGYEVGTANFNPGGSPFTVVGYGLSRAPGFFDEVCYTGDSTLGRAIPHNLAAVPELMIVKNRNDTENWVTYSAPTGNTTRMILNSAAASSTRAVWADTTPTSTNFYVGGSGVLGETNFSSYTYVAYLFATCPGVSKVGSYTGTAATQTINCGFASGARFVLIKRTDSTGDWYVWDSARGIVAGDDPYLLLNSTAAEVTSTDYVDTAASGFELTATAPAAINASGGSYIFLAIA